MWVCIYVYNTHFGLCMYRLNNDPEYPFITTVMEPVLSTLDLQVQQDD